MKTPTIYFVASSLPSEPTEAKESVTHLAMSDILSRYGKVVITNETLPESHKAVEKADLLVVACGCTSVDDDSYTIDVLRTRLASHSLPTLILMWRENAMSQRVIVSDQKTTTVLYTTKRDVDAAINKFVCQYMLTQTRIVLLGAPGSAKSALARRLQFCVPQLPHIRARQLLNGEKSQLSGFILTDYPFDCADASPQRNVDLVLYIECAQSDSIVRQMQKRTNGRIVSRKAAESRWQKYQKTMPSVNQLRDKWFPTSLVREMHTDYGLFCVNKVYEAICGTLVPQWKECYYVEGVPLGSSSARMPSDRFSLTIDGDVKSVFAIVRTLAKMHPHRLQLIPIDALSLGPQLASDEFGAIYSHMCSHTKTVDLNDAKELSATGRIGRTWSPALPMAVAQLAKLRWEPVTLKIQQVLLKGTLSPTLDLTERQYVAQFADLTDLIRFSEHQLTPTPNFQLQIGFDIAKKSVGERMPIALDALIEKCSAVGMCSGSWALLASETHHKYRASEFSSRCSTKCAERLRKHAARLQRIVSRECGFFVTILFRLEIVHSIHTFR